MRQGSLLGLNLIFTGFMLILHAVDREQPPVRWAGGDWVVVVITAFSLND